MVHILIPYKSHENGLLSGKRLHNYGKSPFFMGKSTITGPFSIAFCMFTRPGKSRWNPMNSHELHRWFRPARWSVHPRWVQPSRPVQTLPADPPCPSPAPEIKGDFGEEKPWEISRKWPFLKSHGFSKWWTLGDDPVFYCLTHLKWWNYMNKMWDLAPKKQWRCDKKSN